MTEKEWATLEPGDFIGQRTSPGLVMELDSRDHAGSWIGIVHAGAIKIRSAVIYTLPALWELRARHSKASTASPSIGK